MGYLYFAKYGIVGLLLVVGYFVVNYVVKRLLSLMSEHVPSEIMSVLSYFLFYVFYGLFIMVVLQAVGIDVSGLMTAAGIAGVALGFAAQTSFANIISGVMLVVERSFRVGDVIICDGVEGTIESTGLLSFLLRTVDNAVVRIPNEQLIKNKVINLTGAGYRKIGFTISYDATIDSRKLIEKLVASAASVPSRLQERQVTIEYDVASNNAIGVTLYFWVKSRQIGVAKSAYIEQCAPIVVEYGPQSVYIAFKR